MTATILKTKVHIVRFDKNDKRKNDVYLESYNDFNSLFKSPNHTYNKFVLQADSVLKIDSKEYQVKNVVFLSDEYHDPADRQLPFNSELYVEVKEMG